MGEKGQMKTSESERIELEMIENLPLNAGKDSDSVKFERRREERERKIMQAYITSGGGSIHQEATFGANRQSWTADRILN